MQIKDSPEKMGNKRFTIEYTNLCKGVAICIMLFHHLFYKNDSWDLYFHVLNIRTTPVLAYIATQGKICVTIFVLLSAYGLTLSYNKQMTDECLRGGGGNRSISIQNSHMR